MANKRIVVEVTDEQYTAWKSCVPWGLSRSLLDIWITALLTGMDKAHQQHGLQGTHHFLYSVMNGSVPLDKMVNEGDKNAAMRLAAIYNQHDQNGSAGTGDRAPKHEGKDPKDSG